VAGGDIELAGFGEAMVLFESTALATASTVDVHVAGAELNACAAAARLGITAAFCTRVGDDPVGERVRNAIAGLGVGDELTITDQTAPTGLFLKDVRPDGQRRVHYYRRGSAASGMSEADAERLLRRRPRLVIVSGITAALGPGPRAAIRALAGRVPIAFDPNFRPALGPLGQQAEFAREMLPYLSFLLLGTDESELIFGSRDGFAGYQGEMVLKAGAQGCYYREADGSVGHLPSLATEVVDPVGAGDAFAGGYLAARLRGATPARAAWLGSKLAAGVVASHGDTAGLPTTAEAGSLLASVVPPVTHTASQRRAPGVHPRYER
jgi:2-dehydro-3-deoxygluconokinase